MGATVGEERVQRRLAAILAADVVGYSALMERAEEATYIKIGRLWREVIEPNLGRHQGRLIKTTGDGVLAEFASPSAALRCAADIQDQLAASGHSLQLRIGINLGDMIVDEQGDVYGEGINIAARLQALADPGGILISGKVFAEVEGKHSISILKIEARTSSRIFQNQFAPTSLGGRPIENAPRRETRFASPSILRCLTSLPSRSYRSRTCPVILSRSILRMGWLRKSRRRFRGLNGCL